MNTMVMKNAQCPDARSAARAARSPTQRSAVRWPAIQIRRLVRRLGVAVGVAAALGVLVALIAVTPRAVDALSLPPVTATVVLPRVVIHAERLPVGGCPVPTEPGAACPLPLPSSPND